MQQGRADAGDLSAPAAPGTASRAAGPSPYRASDTAFELEVAWPSAAAATVPVAAAVHRAAARSVRSSASDTAHSASSRASEGVPFSRAGASPGSAAVQLLRLSPSGAGTQRRVEDLTHLAHGRWPTSAPNLSRHVDSSQHRTAHYLPVPGLARPARLPTLLTTTVQHLVDRHLPPRASRKGQPLIHRLLAMKAGRAHPVFPALPRRRSAGRPALRSRPFWCRVDRDGSPLVSETALHCLVAVACGLGSTPDAAVCERAHGAQACRRGRLPFTGAVGAVSARSEGTESACYRVFCTWVVLMSREVPSALVGASSGTGFPCWSTRVE